MWFQDLYIFNMWHEAQSGLHVTQHVCGGIPLVFVCVTQMSAHAQADKHVRMGASQVYCTDGDGRPGPAGKCILFRIHQTVLQDGPQIEFHGKVRDPSETFPP